MDWLLIYVHSDLDSTDFDSTDNPQSFYLYLVLVMRGEAHFPKHVSGQKLFRGWA